MLNTGNASTPLTDIYTLEVNVKLKNTISVPSVTDGLDFFIAYQGIGQKRTEIHLTHFNSATANGQLADNEVLEVIKAVNNTWALCVPDKFVYPTETTVITNAYSKFADWAHDQSSTTDWYKTVSSEQGDSVLNFSSSLHFLHKVLESLIILTIVCVIRDFAISHVLLFFSVSKQKPLKC